VRGKLKLDLIPPRHYRIRIHVERFPRVFPVLREREEMVVAAIGGSLAHARRGSHFCDQFGHRLVALSPFLSDAVVAKHPGDFRLLP
jgi:hypothetical protein